ncbi:MAG: glycosyl hydrolase family 28 protein [Bacteroides sp.]|nr:glycosyl hydrolase family 28 protein [Bacteroides sp.]MCI1683535.1 glycosyl hydrolase family 28 protein [Bacteroides sp.]
MKKLKLTAMLLFASIATLEAQIVTYSVPKQLYYAHHNDDYTVRVRQAGSKEWTDLYEYNVKVDADTRSDASMVQFDFNGKIEILVQKNNGEVRDVTIRPLSKGIKPSVDGNYVLFTLDKPQKLSVEFNGDKLHNLHVFANAIETNVPDKKAPGIMYFEAGYHEPDSIEKCFKIPSNTTVYLEGGAVLKGPLLCEHVENVKILGHGMLLETFNGITINYSKNVLVDGITVVNPRYNTTTVGQSENITLKNIKSFSYQGWGDGLDFFCSKHALVEDVFMRNSDDCIAVYGHRWNFYCNTDDIVVRNSTLWADIAHPINIGTHGDTSTEGETLENMHFSNIDILEHDEDDPDYQGCMAVNVGDHNLARNILFDNIRVERIEEGQLFHLRVMYNKKYNTGPGRGVQNITFRNISFTGKYTSPSLMEGYDANHAINDITFENIYINGKKATTLQKLNINRKDFTGTVHIK